MVVEPTEGGLLWRDEGTNLCSSLGFYTLLFGFFVLLFFSSAETVSTSPSLEDFAHCKDEMDVIIVHCGFRLCTVKLWTQCSAKFLWKNGIT